MKLRRLAVLSLATAMVTGTLAGCFSEPSGTAQSPVGEAPEGARSGEPVLADGKGQIYYPSFEPEVADVWVELAEKCTAEAGIPTKVQITAAGTYEQTLKSEVTEKRPPTLFQINGPISYKSWVKRYRDLGDTEIYGCLIDRTMAVIDGDDVYGIPYVIEEYGTVYNDVIMRKYFALDGVKVAFMGKINNFDTLRAVSEDMQVREADLGIDGVFASTSFAPGEDWGWQTRLANLPVYYEYRNDDVSDKDAIDSRYSDSLRNIFDLYLSNFCTDPETVGAKIVEDPMTEFTLGKVAMVQNGNWGWGQVAGVEGDTVKEEDVEFLPIYTRMTGEEKQKLCIGTENFFVIDSQAKAEDQQAPLDFLTWLFSSEADKGYITNRLDLITPFDTFTADEKPSDPLAREVGRYMNNDNLYSISWNFTSFPSQIFKDDSSASLLQYAQGGKEWRAVMDDIKAGWENEEAMTK